MKSDRLAVPLEFISKGEPVQKLLKLCGLSRSSYYYQPNGNRQGRKPYARIFDNELNEVGTEDIVVAIKQLFENPFVDYGYYKTWVYLRENLNYKISRRSTYIIMTENALLNFVNKQKTKTGIRNRAEAMVPQPTVAFSYWELDIKYLWIQGKRRNAQVLTIIDVFSRWNIGQYIAFEIRLEQVISLFKSVMKQHLAPEEFIVRTDNGSHFIARKVQHYLEDIGAEQEFTKPATPQMNAHIESYHSIMEATICQRFEFDSITNFRDVMENFRSFYNL